LEPFLPLKGTAGTTGALVDGGRSGGSVDARRDYPELTPAFPPTLRGKLEVIVQGALAGPKDSARVSVAAN